MAAAPNARYVASGALYGLPAPANALAWSEDNLLAVATGRSVVLVSPAALEGPRAVIAVDHSEGDPEAEGSGLDDGLCDFLSFLAGPMARGVVRGGPGGASNQRPCVFIEPNPDPDVAHKLRAI